MRTRFITSAASPSDFPTTDLPEVAFVGRSNVGKSSLLNAIVREKIARTSRTPGRTQLINFFEIIDAGIKYQLADLPGRGWARAPGSVRMQWNALIDRYLETREPLMMVLFLLDARRGAEEEDVLLHRDLIERLGPRGIGVEVVATKVDKLSKAEIKPAIGAMANALAVPKLHITPTSSSKRTGLDALRARYEARMR